MNRRYVKDSLLRRLISTPAVLVKPWSIALLFGFMLSLGCNRPSAPPKVVSFVETISEEDWEPFEKLSSYKLFTDNGATQNPAKGVIPYDINSALFSDYATKYRFIKLPEGKTAQYHETDVFDFPVGTVIAKTFAYPRDLRDASKGRELIETRILLRRPTGWAAYPYRWNATQDDAKLELAGDMTDVSWIHHDGEAKKLQYLVPNANQCKACHENDRVLGPIGPKARNLNKTFAYSTGIENQLSHWISAGVLAGAPSPDKAPRLAKWDDPSTGTLDERARAYLEINCAHCHNPKGPAKTSGLELWAHESIPVKWGHMKTPVAAGRGAGGRKYDVVPGKPDESIMQFRLESTDPGIMMPELGRRMVDHDGAKLIREWIATMRGGDVSARKVYFPSEEGGE